MGVFTCTKPATFAGVKYMPGDTVPAEAIPADRVGAVIRLGLIAEAQPAAEAQREPEPPATTTFTVPVTLEDGTVYDATVTPGGRRGACRRPADDRGGSHGPRQGHHGRHGPHPDRRV